MTQTRTVTFHQGTLGLEVGSAVASGQRATGCIVKGFRSDAEGNPGQAELSGKVREGDHITAVDGLDTVELSYDKVLALLFRARVKSPLEVTFAGPGMLKTPPLQPLQLKLDGTGSTSGISDDEVTHLTLAQSPCEGRPESEAEAEADRDEEEGLRGFFGVPVQGSDPDLGSPEEKSDQLRLAGQQVELQLQQPPESQGNISAMYESIDLDGSISDAGYDAVRAPQPLTMQRDLGAAAQSWPDADAPAAAEEQGNALALRLAIKLKDKALHCTELEESNRELHQQVRVVREQNAALTQTIDVLREDLKDADELYEALQDDRARLKGVVHDCMKSVRTQWEAIGAPETEAESAPEAAVAAADNSSDSDSDSNNESLAELLSELMKEKLRWVEEREALKAAAEVGRSLTQSQVKENKEDRHKQQQPEGYRYDSEEAATVVAGMRNEGRPQAIALLKEELEGVSRVLESESKARAHAEAVAAGLRDELQRTESGGPGVDPAEARDERLKQLTEAVAELERERDGLLDELKARAIAGAERLEDEAEELLEMREELQAARSELKALRSSGQRTAPADSPEQPPVVLSPIAGPEEGGLASEDEESFPAGRRRPRWSRAEAERGQGQARPVSPMVELLEELSAVVEDGERREQHLKEEVDIGLHRMEAIRKQQDSFINTLVSAPSLQIQSLQPLSDESLTPPRSSIGSVSRTQEIHLSRQDLRTIANLEHQVRKLQLELHDRELRASRSDDRASEAERKLNQARIEMNDLGSQNKRLQHAIREGDYDRSRVETSASALKIQLEERARAQEYAGREDHRRLEQALCSIERLEREAAAAEATAKERELALVTAADERELTLSEANRELLALQQKLARESEQRREVEHQLEKTGAELELLKASHRTEVQQLSSRLQLAMATAESARAMHQTAEDKLAKSLAELEAARADAESSRARLYDVKVIATEVNTHLSATLGKGDETARGGGSGSVVLSLHKLQRRSRSLAAELSHSRDTVQTLQRASKANGVCLREARRRASQLADSKRLAEQRLEAAMTHIRTSQEASAHWSSPQHLLRWRERCRYRVEKLADLKRVVHRLESSNSLLRQEVEQSPELLPRPAPPPGTAADPAVLALQQRHDSSVKETLVRPKSFLEMLRASGAAAASVKGCDGKGDTIRSLKAMWESEVAGHKYDSLSFEEGCSHDEDSTVDGLLGLSILSQDDSRVWSQQPAGFQALTCQPIAHGQLVTSKPQPPHEPVIGAGKCIGLYPASGEEERNPIHPAHLQKLTSLRPSDAQEEEAVPKGERDDDESLPKSYCDSC
ncbi:unnamed protein product [Chrysoparadoxa australica]